MRVRVRNVEFRQAPPEVIGASSVEHLELAKGDEHEVYAVCVFEGMTSFQIIVDRTFPIWRRSWFFEVVDPSLPHDWICKSFQDQPSLVIGPEFLARDIQS